MNDPDQEYQKAGERWYRFDTWANIHYGFVGKTSGFSDDELLEGADLAQLIVDMGKGLPKSLKAGELILPQRDPQAKGFRAFDPTSDRATIHIGIDLWKQYRAGLWPQDII